MLLKLQFMCDPNTKTFIVKSCKKQIQLLLFVQCLICIGANRLFISFHHNSSYQYTTNSNFYLLNNPAWKPAAAPQEKHKILRKDQSYLSQMVTGETCMFQDWKTIPHLCENVLWKKVDDQRWLHHKINCMKQRLDGLSSLLPLKRQGPIIFTG